MPGLAVRRRKAEVSHGFAKAVAGRAIQLDCLRAVADGFVDPAEALNDQRKGGEGVPG